MPSVTNPMQQAVYRGCVECIRMLVETPPYYSVDATCGVDGLRPIHIAAREGHIQTLRFLSASGACLQRGDFGGCTALHHAANAGQLRAVRWLLRHGAKILLDSRGRSPIQIAADHDYMEIVNVLAKHALSTPPIPVTSPIPQNYFTDGSETISNNHLSSAQTSDKDTSDFTGSAADHYTLHTETTQTISSRNSDHKPFSHLQCGDTTDSNSTSKITTSTGDCASSSGNSSLSVSTSAPSLSPSASSSSAISCGCTTSEETTTVFKTESDGSDTFTLEGYPHSGGYQSSNSSSLISSPSPFYLHPPGRERDRNRDSPKLGGDTPAVECGKGILKKSNHRRQPSTAHAPSSTPFFLHPPENLVSETQKAVTAKMAPAPVNSSHAHLHFADPCTDSTPKLKVGLAESSCSSSTSSPPQTPPGTKSGMSTTISECISKFQGDHSRTNTLNNKPSSPSHDIKFKNQFNAENNSPAPPPPPPPPPPFPSGLKLNEASKMKIPLPKIPKESTFAPADNHRNGSRHSSVEPENDYEDIEEIQSKNRYEQTRRLLRSISAPQSTNDPSHANGESEEQNYSEKGSSSSTSGHDKPINKPPIGCGKAFIPPHFPSPPKDALIKPSEYLRSIQNKGKPNGTVSSSNGGTNGQNGGNVGFRSASSRVEETIKALGAQLQDCHTGIMSPVPEETNAEDEFEEINPERINGFLKMNDDLHCASHATNSTYNHNGMTDENNNVTIGTTSSRGGCGGMIKVEELMKVNLRKTPMLRTKSAPPLGRVLPDDHVDKPPSSPPATGSSNNCQDGGQDPFKRGTTMSPCSNGTTTTTESSSVKAEVIAELAQSSQMGGVREWKEELKRRQKEQEKAVQKEIEQYYQPVNFVQEVPAIDVTGVPIPDWKRQMMAKKAAERARKEAEEQVRLESEAKRQASIPMWRRQLLQRRESDAKYAQ